LILRGVSPLFFVSYAVAIPIRKAIRIMTTNALKLKIISEAIFSNKESKNGILSDGCACLWLLWWWWCLKPFITN
jgi:hypothetical protein